MHNKILILLIVIICNSVGITTIHPQKFIKKQNQEIQTSYPDMFKLLTTLSADEKRTASIENVNIKRDVGNFLLKDGRLFLCKLFFDETIAFIFKGNGTFTFTPPTQVEKKQLRRMCDVESFKQDFKLLFVIFADTTFNELEKKLFFKETVLPREIDKQIKYCLKYLSDDDTEYFDPAIMKTFLESEQNGLFYAHFSENEIAPFVFQINPYDEEEVTFKKRTINTMYYDFDIVNSFDKMNEQYRLYEMAKVDKYKIDINIGEDLDFSAAADLNFITLHRNQNWIKYNIYSELNIDSIITPKETQIDFYKGKNNPVLWLYNKDSFRRDQKYQVRIYYSGDLLQNSELDWIGIKSASNWYPREGRNSKCNYDLNYKYPSKYNLFSTGVLVSQEFKDDFKVSRWVSEGPIQEASFNIGFFEENKIVEPYMPNIIVCISSEGHKTASRFLVREGITSQSDMLESVSSDISNSVKFFNTVFGNIQVENLYVTEIPYSHGQAFPNLIHLSWETFQLSDDEGYSEIFRAHEVAHQWWGINVGFKSYHDQWLSEGFAEYSGLWYMQTVLKDNERFFGVLNKWKEEIIDVRNSFFGKGQEAAPIWLGRRASTSETEGDYNLLVYKKAAWVMHMLRMMLLDLGTMNEDNFKNMMRDYYSTFYGKNASTEDFKQIVDKHFRSDMTWFFNQWIYGTEIPRYEFAYKVFETDNGKYKATCRVRQKNVPDTFLAVVPICIDFGEGRLYRLRTQISGNVCEFELPLMPMEPEEIIFNDLNSVLCEVEYVDWD